MIYKSNQSLPTTNPRSITREPIIEKLVLENHAVMLPWLASISDSLSAIKALTMNHKIKTNNCIDLYYHIDDILAISQNFTHKGDVFNLDIHAKNLLKSL